MFKVFKSEDRKITVAIKEGTKYDAVKKVAKILHLGNVISNDGSIKVNDIGGRELARLLKLDELLISNRYSGKVTCSEEDILNDEVGRNEAIKKVNKHYKDSMDRIIYHWQYAMLKKIKAVNPETFKKIIGWF